MAIATSLNPHAPRVLSIVRIMAGLIFLAHGTQKFFAFPPRGLDPANLPPAPASFSMSWWAGAIELVTGVLIVLGLFTRPAAFIASGTMAFAYFIAHAPRSFFPALNNGDASILYCFFFLYLVFAGPGPWSIDAKRGAQ